VLTQPSQLRPQGCAGWQWSRLLRVGATGAAWAAECTAVFARCRRLRAARPGAETRSPPGGDHLSGSWRL